MSDDDKPKQKYQYTQLASIDPKSTENKKINIYGVVIDATFPYFLESNGKHLCILKIMDPTFNPATDQTKFIKVSIFAKDINMLPRVHSVGDIIRIHRAFPKLFNQTLQINCEMPRASWALFRGDTDPSAVSQYIPLAQSGKTLTIEGVDKKTIDSLREFSCKLLSEKPLGKERCILLKDSASQPKDFDAICQVLSLKQNKTDYTLKVCDNTNALKVHLSEGLAKSLSLIYGDVIKLRGVTAKDAQNLQSDKYSNILVLPQYSKIKAELLQLMKSPSSNINLELLSHSFLENPVKVSKVIDPKLLEKAYSPLSSLLKTEKFLKVKANVVDIQPSEVSQWVVKYNKKSKEIEQVTPTTVLKQDEILCYRIQLILKEEDAADDTLYRVVLFTGDESGKEFLPAPLNVSTVANVPLAKKLKKLKKLMMSFNIVCDLGLASHNYGGQVMWMVTGTQICT
jgi:hypothetical protein